MERITKDITRNASGTRAARGQNRALAALAAAVVTCGLAGNATAQGASSTQSMKGESGERSQARANAGQPSGKPAGNAPGNAAGNPTGNAKTAAPKSDWTRHFTPEERDAWQQKIAAAPDEAERRKLRGQRLAEIQRRTRAQKAEAGASASASAGAGAGAQPTARPVRQASPEASTPAQRPR